MFSIVSHWGMQMKTTATRIGKILKRKNDEC